MGQFSNSFPKHFSYLCEYAFRLDLSCSFCEYPFIFHCLHCSPSCFDPDSLLLAYLWLGLSWIDCISANKSFSSPKTSSRKPYTSSKQQERQKQSVETTINFSEELLDVFHDTGVFRGSPLPRSGSLVPFAMASRASTSRTVVVQMLVRSSQWRALALRSAVERHSSHSSRGSLATNQKSRSSLL